MKLIHTSGPIELHIDYSQSVGYAFLLNGGKVVRKLSIKNIGDTPLGDVRLSIEGFYYFTKIEDALGEIAPGEVRELSDFEVISEINRLLTLNDPVSAELRIAITCRDQEPATFRFPITILPWNYWKGDEDTYKDIASFVTPDSPNVISIIEKAVNLLKEGSKLTRFSGYDVADDGDVDEQIGAIWSALLRENLKFISVSSDFLDVGQRIMTPELISRSRRGNYLDLTLLLCSCLEQIGLSPCLVFSQGRVMTGVWLDPEHKLTDTVSKASEEIKEYVTGDDASLMLIDSSAMCRGLELDQAFMSALSMLEEAPVELAVDIKKARKEGVTPIPIDTGDIVFKEDDDIKGFGEEVSESSRRLGWERKLLDLTLRNVMLNIRSLKSIVPVWEHDTARVVEFLKSKQLADFIGSPENDNLDHLKHLDRAARVAIEENGANSLFVSLGALRWFDGGDKRPHVAPLLFIPVNIVRKKASTFEISLREDEAMINVTLLEMLRQMFGVAIPELKTVPLDEEEFPDWRKVLDILAVHVEDINKRQPDECKWELRSQSYIGIFSFKKFLMWHDIHFNPEMIESHHVLRGLIDNNYQPDCDITPEDARALEAGKQTDLMLPIDYDSSQLEAINASNVGQSFVLHGPPGTGKSQTITNMIANAMYSGKRVLFVAEKKAALDVVRARLNSLGLEQYCLELHSNKADKRSFFSQIEATGLVALGSRRTYGDKAEDFSSTAKVLKNVQKYLDEITEAIHSEREYGQSFYDYVNRLLETSYSDLVITLEDIKHLTPTQINELCTEYSSLDLVAEILGHHPALSDLRGLYPCENTIENQNAVTDLFAQMPAAIAEARRKARKILNRWFFKRTPDEIFRQNPLLNQLHDVVVIDEDKCSDIDTFERYVEKWNGAIKELRQWYYFTEKKADLEKYNLPKALNFYLEGRGGQETADAVYAGYFRTLADHVLENDKQLRSFSGRLHENRIKRYCSAVKKFQKLSRVELVRKMEQITSKSALSMKHKRQLALLGRRMQINGRGVALRKIIGDSSDVLGKIFPCMLMSPLSVAQYLAMKPDQFDIVIFDEASQMETPDAVGTIARGKSLVVVGDPLQLPPTRFFTSRSTAGQDFEESEDSNSILEDCITLGMPSRYLSRHYRSRHESLIAFSNNYYYANRLLTFPSHNDSEKKVTFVNPEGIYDHGKSRTNVIEAEAVVHCILGMLEESEKAPSIGIVAFSKAQSNLIEDVLNNKLQYNKEAQLKLDKAKEPLFIKNLENVQGDERDIIIFSIGYGPDKNGNVSLNFGPLNQSGGERRLNVAVSRAREEMIVFSSLLPQHIPAEGSYSKGVVNLRNFLAYAINGKLTQDADYESEKEGIVEDIAQKLRDRGYNVVTKVGKSSYKIDVAVVDDDNKENYCLGIILDGRDYRNLPTVRDREITVPSVLSSLGWNLKRVWVMDWIEKSDTVLSDISETIDKLKGV